MSCPLERAPTANDPHNDTYQEENDQDWYSGLGQTDNQPEYDIKQYDHYDYYNRDHDPAKNQV